MGIGSAAANITVKYAKSQYEAKIAELEGYNKQLNYHLDVLEAKKAEIAVFWTDDQGAKAQQRIASMITKVKRASKKIENLNTIYQKAVDSLEKQQSDNEIVLDTIENLLSGLPDE